MSIAVDLMTTSTVDFALAYARLGMRVFPLEPGSKRPHGNKQDLDELKARGQERHTPHRLAPNGYHCATSDERQIREWWSKDPLAGIGWVPGPDHLVLDVDVKNGKDGVASLAQLTGEHGPVSTLVGGTPSGGFHLVFSTPAMPGREGTDVLGSGLDIKASNGYVVLPPTVVAGGAYAWMNWDPLEGQPSIAPAPAWMLDLLGQPAACGTGKGARAADAEDAGAFDRELTADRVDESTLEELRAAIEHISADPYSTWIAMGEALATLKSTDFAHDARDIWLEWSATSEKFDEAEAESKWRSFKPRRTSHAAVFAEAQRCGWVNPRVDIGPASRTAQEVIAELRTLEKEKVLEVWAEQAKHLPRDASKLVIDEVARLTGVGPRPLQGTLSELQKEDAAHRREIVTLDRIGDRLEIEYRPEDRSLMAETLETAIIGAAAPGEYISFAGALCEVATKEMPGTHLIDSPDGEPPAVPLIVPLDDVAILARAERVAVFYRFTKNGRQLIGVPREVIEIVRGKRKHAAPEVAGLVTHPIVLPNGEIVATDGLHEKSRLFLMGTSIADARPFSKTEAARAIERLRATFLEGFEFADVWDADVALAGLFTAVLRRVLDIAPGLVVMAHMQASGKTTLVRIIHIILTGQDLPVSTFPQGDEAEVQKRLLSALMRSPALVCFDNLEDGKTFCSPAIAGAMTSPTFTQRLLGASRDVEVPTNAMFVLTGNNLALGADEESRWLVSSLAPKATRPSERTFRNPDVVAHALSIRAQVLRDVVGVVAGYIRTGEHMPTATRFARWDRMVRQPLIWTGCSDMRLNFASNAERSAKGQALAELLTALVAHFDGVEFTASAVANPGFPSEQHEDLRDALTALGAKDPGNSTSVGAVLASHVGRVASIAANDGSQRDARLHSRLVGGRTKYCVQC